MKFVQRGLSFLLAVIILCGMVLWAWAATGEKIYNYGQRDTLCKELSEQAQAYYIGDYDYKVLKELPGAKDNGDSYQATKDNELYDALFALMSSTQTGYFSYSSLKQDFAYTDTENGKNNNTMTCLWTDVTSEFSVGNFNREHVWPKSHASFYQKNGGADRHHLRPVSGEVNQVAHWHRPFGTATDGITAYGESGAYGGLYTTEGGTQDIGYFEPADNAKGDTARILLYVYVRWQQPNLYSDVEKNNLPQMDGDDNANDGLRVMEDLETLLKWCELDPVDTWEMGRNDAIERIQGNRNVFIDYPELAWLLFGEEIPAGMATPTSTGCEHQWCVSEEVPATCTDDGELVRICSLCQKEQTIISDALGHMDDDDDGSCDRCEVVLQIEQQFVLTEDLNDGDALVLYNLFEGQTLTIDSGSVGYVAGIFAEPQEDVLYPPMGTAVFTVEYVNGTDFYLISDGKYLSTAKTGSTLDYTEAANEFSIWYLDENPMGSGFFVRSRNAAYSGKYNQAIQFEYDSNHFTVYGITSTTSINKQFSFLLYTAADDTGLCQDGHTPSVAVAENEVNATCTEGGSYDMVAYCSVCHVELGRETVLTDPLGHDWDDGTVTVEATETEEGVLTYACSRCAETKTEPIPALDGGEEPVSFGDIQADAWYYDAVYYAVEEGLMNGVGNGKFDPDGAMTRAMLVTVLWRYAGSPTGYENPFADLTQDWYMEAVAWAAANSIVNGVGDGHFDPEGSITREQMATILYRYCDKVGIDTSARADLSVFPDSGKVDSWAEAALSWANAMGLITGSEDSGTVYLLPLGNATRAQVATILMRFIENVAK